MTPVVSIPKINGHCASQCIEPAVKVKLKSLKSWKYDTLQCDFNKIGMVLKWSFCCMSL